MYDSPIKDLPVWSMLLSMGVVCIITLFQLQTVIHEKQFKQHEKWATIAWASIQILLCILFITDGLEAANIIFIGLVAGIILSIVIVVVGTCACYVIMLNGNQWYPHIHLTCICFWTVIQYMSIRLPSDELHYMTTVPVVLMCVLRATDWSEIGCNRTAIGELFIWCICIVLHLFCDNDGMTKLTFLWGASLSVTALIMVNRYASSIIVMALLPVFFCVSVVYILRGLLHHKKYQTSFNEVCSMYDKWTAEPENIPLDLEYGDEDFGVSL